MRRKRRLRKLKIVMTSAVCEHNKQTVVKQLSRSVEVLLQAVSPRESCSLIDLSVN